MPAENNPFAEYMLKHGYGTRPTFTAMSAPLAPVREACQVAEAVEELATERQRGFIASLITQRDYSDHKYAARIDEVHLGQGRPLTKAGASKLIDVLKECPFRPSTARQIAAEVKWPTVPAGRYAVATEDGALNALAFYRVDRPEDGRWAGYVFVSLMQSDEELKVGRDAAEAVLAKIAVDPEAASAAYGQHIGECGVCGRTLTNDESRARGIGPKCAAKAGW